ncbi:MAG: hypothetical protein K8T89_04815 [Planctomycetes bacterium]|nr:hypothetical protein [Planctomycetota bacterium]
MFRKFFTAVVALVFVAGGLFADEIKGVFKKFEGGKVTVEVDGKTNEYKVGDAKVKIRDKEVAISEALGKWKEGDKGTFTVEKGEVTKIARSRK